MKRQLLLVLLLIVFKSSSSFSQCNPDIATGLITGYDFLGNANDLTGNGHNGTVHGAVFTTDRCGNPNSALMFSRTDTGSTYVEVSNATPLSISQTDYTISYWVYEPDSSVRGGNAIVKRNGTGPTNGYFTGTNASTHKINFTIAGGSSGSFNLFSNASIDSITWTLVCITYSYSSKRMKMYVNAILDKDTTNVRSPTATTANFIIGRDFVSNTAPRFNGKIDDIRVYNRELDSCAIQQLYITSCNALPISLLSFSGTVINNSSAILNWRTAQEINTDYFVIERSFDGKTYTSLKQIQAAGNSSVIRNYKVTDELPQNGNNYYRIKTIDKDGSASYSKSVLLTINLPKTKLSVYPNPVKNNLTVKFYSNMQQKVQVQVVDGQGKIVQQNSYQVQIGVTLLNVNTSALTKGLYQVSVNGQKNISQTFLKQ